jgi:hypothetical protein
LAQELIDTSYEMIASKSQGRERPSLGREGAKKKRTRRKTS